MAKDLLGAVDAGDVKADALAELEVLSVEDVHDRAGPSAMAMRVSARSANEPLELGGSSQS